MNYHKFYKLLFRPIEKQIGPIDAKTIMAIVGFDCGGPVSVCTVGRGREQFVTYVTCELSVREEQKPAKFGRYEFMMTCDDKSWTHNMLTRLGQMSLEAAFGHGHTVDMSQVVKAGCPLQGLVVEEFARVQIDGNGYGILRIHGTTESELQFAKERGTDTLLEKFKRADIYPRTSTKRKQSVI